MANRFSLAMIVKDEERMLPDMLRSTRGLFDEIIIVDTGSTDNTVAVATAAGAQVIHWEWQNDFAAARNVSLQAVTGDWVAFFDADERLSLKLCRQLKRLVNSPQNIGAATITMRNSLPNGSFQDSQILRVFRHSPKIQFQYRIHEEVSHSVQEFLEANDLKLADLDGVAEHLGYITHVAAAKDKLSRDQSLLEQILSENPKDIYSHFKLLELARYWDEKNLWHQSAIAANLVLSDMEYSAIEAFHYNHELLCLIGLGLFPNQPEESLKYIRHWTKDIPVSVHSKYCMGYLLEEMGEHKQSALEYRECLRLSSSRDPQLTNVRPLMGICRLALMKGDFLRAYRSTLSALSFSQSDDEVLVVGRMLSRRALNKGEWESTLSIMKIIAQSNHELKDVILLGQAVLLGGDVNKTKMILTAVQSNSIEVSIGMIVCQLCCGEECVVDINTSSETAIESLKEWVDVVLRSHNGLLTKGFLENGGVLLSAFPWMESHIQNGLSRKD
jgi:glycosyltransferase involved in cell wall biosynthesis